MKHIFILSAMLFAFTYVFAQQIGANGGWRQTGYTFVDGSSNIERVLAGTSSKMNDVTKFKGAKGAIKIAYNRFDQKTGALLAGVTYEIKWTDPPATLFPGEKIKMHYQLRTVTSKSWTPNPQSVSFNQGISGLFLLNPAGENYFKKDFNNEIISNKAVEKGNRNNEEKAITANFGSGFKAIYSYVWDENLSQTQAPISKEVAEIKENTTGWHLTDYSFIDGTSNIERVLAGTSSKMNDITKFIGNKGSIEISYNRYDQKTGKLLAGVNYAVKWSDPPTVLIAGEPIRINYQLKTITSKSWTPNPQSVSFNQGISGLFLFNRAGENYFKKDFNEEIVSKPVNKGYKKDETKAITVNLGSGFKAVYTYQWREF